MANSSSTAPKRGTRTKSAAKGSKQTKSWSVHTSRVGRIGRSAASTVSPSSAREKLKGSVLGYDPKKGVRAYVRLVARANPLQLVALERAGVSGAFIKDLAAHMHMPASRMFETLGLPKATAERKAAEGKPVTGSGGHAAIAMAKLLGIAQEILADSTAPEAAGFDDARWLGAWIERPQPSLGGRPPADFLGTPTGFEVVARLLRSIESGSYQ
jgi:putative toxin-antitoxin system antitoxin component (TIGR02293 family)